MKMGKPDGPITFNGKQVQPGAPEYAAASAALIAAQGKSQQARGRLMPNNLNQEKKLAASGAPVQTGAVSREFEESIVRQDDAILAMIRNIRV
jgi:hypothetical protein